MKRLVVIVAVLAGCASPEPNLAPGDPLSGTRWSLVSIGGSPVLASESTSMLFDTGRLSGSDGCNRYATKYTAWENNLQIGRNVIGTRAACSPPVMDEATTFLGILGRTAAFRRDGNRMMLFDGEGRPLAAFQRIEP